MRHLVTFCAVAGVLAVSGCQAAPDPIPEEEVPAPVSVDSDSAQDVEVVPQFVEGGSASDNLPYIDYVLTQAGAGAGLFRSLDAVETLEEAGFDRADMEVTSDRTALELAAESITVAVVIGEECALGQWGNDWYASEVTPLLGTGGCLLGDTLSLD